MGAFDKIREGFESLAEAGVPRDVLEKWEEKAINEVNRIERENRAQQLLPFGKDHAASVLDCSWRNVYYLAQRARARKIIEERAKIVATNG